MTLHPAITSLGLKEWAVAVHALAHGKQVLIIRKGGIHRDDKEFRVVHPEFLLYPTYEHQQRELLKPEFHEDLEITLEEDDIPGLVTLSYWCEVTDVFETTDQEDVDRISDSHIWTNDYAQKRLHWRPKYPLTIALLRVHELEQPQALPILEEFAGCKSWVDLRQEVPLGRMSPVLSDEEYEKRADEVRQRLGTGRAAAQ